MSDDARCDYEDFICFQVFQWNFIKTPIFDFELKNDLLNLLCQGFDEFDLKNIISSPSSCQHMAKLYCKSQDHFFKNFSYEQVYELVFAPPPPCEEDDLSSMESDHNGIVPVPESSSSVRPPGVTSIDEQQIDDHHQTNEQIFCSPVEVEGIHHLHDSSVPVVNEEGKFGVSCLDEETMTETLSMGLLRTYLRFGNQKSFRERFEDNRCMALRLKTSQPFDENMLSQPGQRVYKDSDCPGSSVSEAVSYEIDACCFDASLISTEKDPEIKRGKKFDYCTSIENEKVGCGVTRYFDGDNPKSQDKEYQKMQFHRKIEDLKEAGKNIRVYFPVKEIIQHVFVDEYPKVCYAKQWWKEVYDQRGNENIHLMIIWTEDKDILNVDEKQTNKKKTALRS